MSRKTIMTCRILNANQLVNMHYSKLNYAFINLIAEIQTESITSFLTIFGNDFQTGYYRLKRFCFPHKG